jgi:hypothetical protein
MAKTKVQFVADFIRDNPNDSRERIINKIARHNIAYRGKKFTKKMASKYYWYVTTQANAPVERKSKDRLTITFDKGASNYERLTYALKVLAKAGIVE